MFSRKVYANIQKGREYLAKVKAEGKGNEVQDSCGFKWTVRNLKLYQQQNTELLEDLTLAIDNGLVNPTVDVLR